MKRVTMKCLILLGLLAGLGPIASGTADEVTFTNNTSYTVEFAAMSGEKDLVSPGGKATFRIWGSQLSGWIFVYPKLNYGTGAYWGSVTLGRDLAVKTAQNNTGCGSYVSKDDQGKTFELFWSEVVGVDAYGHKEAPPKLTVNASGKTTGAYCDGDVTVSGF